MRGYDWTRGPVIAGGLPGSEANEDLARMGVSVALLGIQVFINDESKPNTLP
jgi:uncharacterized protein related to proFAR isomerase